jgi:predicted Zn-dependent protease
MMAQFYAGRPKSAIEAGNRALALNPNNSDVSAKLGTVMFASGFYDSAVSLAVDSSKAVDAAPRDALLVLALDAYRRGDWSSASLLAEQVNCSDFVVRALRAAALGQLDSPQAAGRLADLRGIEPDFEKTFRQRVEARRYPPFIATSLQRGLAKAGANFVPDAIASAL